MDAQDAKIHGPSSLTTVFEINIGNNRKCVDEPEQGHKLMRNTAEVDG